MYSLMLKQHSMFKLCRHNLYLECKPDGLPFDELLRSILSKPGKYQCCIQEKKLQSTLETSRSAYREGQTLSSSSGWALSLAWWYLTSLSSRSLFVGEAMASFLTSIFILWCYAVFFAVDQGCSYNYQLLQSCHSPPKCLRHYTE